MIVKEKNGRRRIGPVGALTLALGLALGTTTSSSHAFGPVVEVGVNLYQSIMNQINTLSVDISTALAQGQAASEYVKTLMRWKETLENWAQKLSSFQQMIATGGIGRNLPIEKIDPNFNVAERCGGGSGFSLSSLASALSSKLSGSTNIAEKRRDICTAIQLLENKRHNDTVDMINGSIPSMQAYLNLITKIRSEKNTEGAMAESSNNALQSANRIEVEFQQWERENQLMDQYIGALQRQQQVLTTQALSGERSTVKLLAGTLVQAGTMAAALKPEEKKSDK